MATSPFALPLPQPRNVADLAVRENIGVCRPLPWPPSISESSCRRRSPHRPSPSTTALLFSTFTAASSGCCDAEAAVGFAPGGMGGEHLGASPMPMDVCSMQSSPKCSALWSASASLTTRFGQHAAELLFPFPSDYPNARGGWLLVLHLLNDQILVTRKLWSCHTVLLTIFAELCITTGQLRDFVILLLFSIVDEATSRCILQRNLCPESLSHEEIMGLREKCSNTCTLLTAGTISLEGVDYQSLVPKLPN